MLTAEVSSCFCVRRRFLFLVLLLVLCTLPIGEPILILYAMNRDEIVENLNKLIESSDKCRDVCLGDHPVNSKSDMDLFIKGNDYGYYRGFSEAAKLILKWIIGADDVPEDVDLTPTPDEPSYRGLYETPEGDFLDYLDRYGVTAFAVAIAEMLTSKELKVTWNQAQQLWERGGKIHE